jgi:AAA domain, putative AbiEii toxin, Type IV TA system
MINSIHVARLLGQYDHTIEFGDDWEFAIAYGLNGVGKTKLLELIDNVLRLQIRDVARADFKRLTLSTDDDRRLVVTRQYFAGERPSARIAMTLGADGAEDTTWMSSLEIPDLDDLDDWLRSNTSWKRFEGDYWQDSSDGEMAHISELRQRYSFRNSDQMYPENIREAPPEFATFAAEHRTVLITTQRLGNSAFRRPAVNSPRAARQMFTVDSYSGDLRQRLERALASNSVTSQSLDRTFPGRIMNQSLTTALTEEEIRELHGDQNERRARLADIGLIGAESDLPLPTKELEPWQRAVLTTYLRDADEKLSTFNDLLGRINVLEELVNERFLNKSIDITAVRGLVVNSTLESKEIPASGLSTGEQHELVLLYNLLFNIPEGSLVLVDEPEISLHVSWQQKFLEDVTRIARSNKIRFLIATHSPQIIGKWWSRTSELGPHEEVDGA